MNGPDFRDWRKREGIGLNQAARHIRVSKQFLSFWERDERRGMVGARRKRLELFVYIRENGVGSTVSMT